MSSKDHGHRPAAFVSGQKRWHPLFCCEQVADFPQRAVLMLQGFRQHLSQLRVKAQGFQQPKPVLMSAVYSMGRCPVFWL